MKTQFDEQGQQQLRQRGDPDDAPKPTVARDAGGCVIPEAMPIDVKKYSRPALTMMREYNPNPGAPVRRVTSTVTANCAARVRILYIELPTKVFIPVMPKYNQHMPLVEYQPVLRIFIENTDPWP